MRAPVVLIILIFSCLANASNLLSDEIDQTVLTKIAFGSCARERQQQPVWQDIIAQQPQLFLMIGDNHYADFWEKDGRMVMQPVPNAERLHQAYQALGQIEGFQKLRASCPLMATWDDHDYGANDMGNDFVYRKESQQEFIKFYGFAASHPIHNQQGIYQAATFGPIGKRTQIILLDTRYHRDRLERSETRSSGRGPYRPTANTETTVLGEQQWGWLKSQLQQPADLRIIASSIQVVADEHGYETWGNFPHERQRLYQLIKETSANGVVFISGDRHLLEISCDDTRNTPYPMWDFTSSGLTQKKQPVFDRNQFRIGPVRREQNFGVIAVDWSENAGSTRVHFRGLGESNKLLTRQSILLNSLQVK